MCHWCLYERSFRLFEHEKYIFTAELYCPVLNVLIVVKLDLKYSGYVYFEPVRPNVIFQALNYLRTYNKFYEDISI